MSSATTTKISVATSTPAVVAFELIALPGSNAKQGLSLRALMDAAAARMLISGMTGAGTGLSYSNGEIAQWMATILSTYYPGHPADNEWAEAKTTADRDAFGSAHAVRAALSTPEETSAALRIAAHRLTERVGGFCVLEYGHCDLKGKGPAIADWSELQSAKILGRVAASATMSTTFMIFTDQRAALKTAKADANSASAQGTAAAIIAAAVAIDNDMDH